jgi:hypothetical protein
MTYKLYYLFLRSSSSKILQNLYIKLILKNKKINLKRFVQPSGYEQSWEKCAEILIGVGYPRNSCVIDDMFKWLQDLNWQGAKQIKAYLPLLPRDVFISHYEKALIESINSNDEDWLYFLHYFYFNLKLNASDFNEKNIVEKLEYIKENY